MLIPISNEIVAKFPITKLFLVSPVGWDNMVVSSLLQSTNCVVLKIYELVYVLVYYQEGFSQFFFSIKCILCAIFFNACYICTKSLNHSAI